MADAARRPAFAAAMLTALALSGCATSGADAPAPTPAAAAPAPAPADGRPEWFVGTTWPVMDDGPILAAARTTLEQCALGETPGLENARLVTVSRGLRAVDPQGAEKVALTVVTPAGEPAARELKMRWADGVGAAGRVAVLAGARNILAGKPPCPAAAPAPAPAEG